MKVCFDVDGTLIDTRGKPRHEVIDLFRSFQALGCEMFIWSGGGCDYATIVKNKLGLDADVMSKGSFQPDLAVDDQIVTMGKVNLKV